VPRAGLSTPAVIAAAADLADEAGHDQLTMALLAQRLGVQTPSLYKHVQSLDDVRRRVAALAMTELGDAVRDAVAGRSGRDALAGLATAFRQFVTQHPGRYATTVGSRFAGPDDPLLAASGRLLNAIAAVLRGYDVRPEEMTHALRTLRSLLHGFTTLQVADAFQWAGDPDDTFAWMIDLVDRALRDPDRPASSRST
jgi:AcrR family transcriptional regulator